MNNQMAFLIGYVLGIVLTAIIAESNKRRLEKACVALAEVNEKLRKQLEYTEAARAKAYKELNWI